MYYRMFVIIPSFSGARSTPPDPIVKAKMSSDATRYPLESKIIPVKNQWYTGP